MTPRISTGRERRVRQTSIEAIPGDHGMHHRAGGYSYDTRTGQDRRVASYRCVVDAFLYTGREMGWDLSQVRDLILALRKGKP